jgi:hypothetical protein
VIEHHLQDSRLQRLPEAGETRPVVTVQSSYPTEIPNSVAVNSISTERKLQFDFSEAAFPPAISPAGKSLRGHRRIHDKNPERSGAQGKSHNSFRRLKRKSLHHFSGDIQVESNELTTSSRRRKSSEQPVNIKYDRRIDRDDMIFTSYRIDGFRQPFGGFKFLKHNDNFDPPVVHMRKASYQRPRSRASCKRT